VGLSGVGIPFFVVIFISMRISHVSMILLVMLVSGISNYAIAQRDTTDSIYDSSAVRNDTTRTRQIINNFKNSRVSQRLVKSITRKQVTDPSATIKSEEFFMPFEGKIIRRIVIEQVGFDRSVVDTTRRIKSTITRIGNRLHNNSREWVICDNLFIRENKPVNPYKMADNERYLRDLDFIQDAKIYIVPLDHTEDSVDVIVRTRDVFSIGGSFNPSSPTKTKLRLYDVNLFGMGQRVQFTGLVENGRTPPFGFEVLYRKASIGGSFITATAGYTQLNTGSSYGLEEEKAYFIRLDRPLVSPYTRMAGGLEISRNWSGNFYNVVDTVFRDYKYLVNDFWVGYNINAKADLRDRNRHFIAFRAFDQHFTEEPFQNEGIRSPIYTNRRYLLAGFTFFKQNFYTARYIYGFGRTEDIPYGHTMSLYFGWARQLGYERPYMGLDVGQSFVSRKGQVYNFVFRAGAFNNSGLEDAALLLSGSLISRLISYKKLLLRQIINADITQVWNQKTNLPLDINNEFGIRGFVTDSLAGTKRFHVNSETLCFTPLTILGFRLAPFGFGEMAWIAADDEFLFKRDPYFGMGGGIRTRNENLVFGTIEMRFIYYPRTVNEMSSYTVRFTSNLRVKYSASFVKPPSFVQYN
jgi:hypothetical protein